MLALVKHGSSDHIVTEAMLPRNAEDKSLRRLER